MGIAHLWGSPTFSGGRPWPHAPLGELQPAGADLQEFPHGPGQLRLGRAQIHQVSPGRLLQPEPGPPARGAPEPHQAQRPAHPLRHRARDGSPSPGMDPPPQGPHTTPAVPGDALPAPQPLFRSIPGIPLVLPKPGPRGSPQFLTHSGRSQGILHRPTPQCPQPRVPLSPDPRDPHIYLAQP